MMTKLIYLFLPVLIWTTMACQNEPKSAADKEYETYYDSVMVIHDRTMPLMGKIDNLREQLKKERKAALSRGDNNLNKINNLLSELNKAEDAMFDWMNGFSPDSIPADQRNKYIQKELSKVEHMEGLMLGSIGMAESHLKNE